MGGGKHHTDNSASMYQLGMSHFKPGANPANGGPWANNPYYMAGWQQAQADYNRDALMQQMMESFMSGGAEESSGPSPEEIAHQQRIAGIMANPSASYSDAAEALGLDSDPYAVAWDSEVNKWVGLDEQAFNSLTEDRAGAIDRYRGIRTQDNTDWRDKWDKALKGEAERDDLYSNYLTAANTATDYINQLIHDERASANLRGVDYTITDEAKQERINNYFATIWSEEDQTKLQGLMDKWGTPDGFTDWVVTRGQADAANSDIANGGGLIKTPSSGLNVKPPKASGEEDEDILGIGG